MFEFIVKPAGKKLSHLKCSKHDYTITRRRQSPTIKLFHANSSHEKFDDMACNEFIESKRKVINLGESGRNKRIFNVYD